MNLVYRDATLDDIQMIADKLEVVHQLANNRGIKFSKNVLIHSLEKSLNYPKSYKTLLAVDGDELVGIVKCALQFYFFSDELSLGDHIIWVSPCYYGDGVGERLLSDAETWAKACGAKSAMFDVLIGINNERANKFFEKCGFELMGYNYFKDLRNG